MKLLHELGLKASPYTQVPKSREILRLLPLTMYAPAELPKIIVTKLPSSVNRSVVVKNN